MGAPVVSPAPEHPEAIVCEPERYGSLLPGAPAELVQAGATR